MTFTNRQQLVGSFGMVTSTHWLATASGMSILERGGNAFDAAAAVGFVLQVVEPHLNGLGGEVPIIAFDAREGRPFVVCGQGTAPAAASIAGMHDLGLDIIPGSGLLPACVPGAFGAWMELLSNWGTKNVADVLEYAIGYAQNGYPMLAGGANAIEMVSELFADHWPSSAAVYLNKKGAPTPGAPFSNKDLAQTYRRLVDAAKSGDREQGIDAARRAFYEGFVADQIEKFVTGTEAMDSSGVPHRGLLTAQDMATWRATIEEPLTYEYRGRTVCKTGPWGQGPVFLQQLALLSGFDLDNTDPCDAEFVHTVVECAKLAFADREAYYGDPEFVTVPMETLLSKAYNDARRQLITETASRELRPGHVDGYSAHTASAVANSARNGHQGGTGDPTVARSGHVSGDTCHLDVVDRWGNMVTATPSGGWLQSAPVVPGLGFCTTSRGQMFWLDEDSPSALAPGKRPRTTLTPSLVLEQDGSPEIAFGTPGGDAQDQWTLLPFLHYVHHGLDLQEAIEAPSFHSTHFPSSFYPREAFPAQLHIEDRFPRETLQELARRGHDVVENESWSLGRCTGVGIRDDGFLTAAATQRGLQDYAAGR